MGQPIDPDSPSFRWLAEFAKQDESYEPPVRAVANARNIFRLRKPGLVTIAREIVAKLVYDSFNEPLPAGIRRYDLPARQTLYSAGNIQLDLKIEVGDESGIIIGQIVANSGTVDIGSLLIELTQRGQIIDKSRTNGLGEFVFEDLPKGNYELQITITDTLVRLPLLPLSN